MKIIPKKRILFFLAIPILFAIGIAVYFGYWITRGVENAPITVRPSLKAVLRAQFIGQLNGGYWEDELIFQSNTISKLPENDRVEFYKFIILNCDLSNYRGIYFTEIIGADAALLLKRLTEYSTTQKFQFLPNQSREAILDWIAILPIIDQQRKYDSIQGQKNTGK